MAGTALSGRRTKKIEWDLFNRVADLTFKQAYLLLRDDSVALIDRVRVCMPLALKRIPDQHQVNVAHFNLNEQLAQRLAQLLNENASSQVISAKQVTDVAAVEFNVVNDTVIDAVKSPDAK